METFFVLSLLIVFIVFACGVVFLSHINWILPCIAVGALITLIFLTKDMLD